MKKLIISTLCILLAHSTHTAQAMLDAKKNEAGPANAPKQHLFLAPRTTEIIEGGKMRRNSMIRKNRPAPLMPLALDFFEKEQKEKNAIDKKLSAIKWLIHDIKEWDGEPMLEENETFENIKSYINNPLLANEYSNQIAYLQNMEEKLTEKLLDAKHKLEEKYYLEEMPRVRFPEAPVSDELIFSLNPEEMAAMHTSDNWRKRLPIGAIEEIPQPLVLIDEE